MNKKAIIGSFITTFIATIIIAVTLMITIFFSQIIKENSQNPESLNQLKIDTYQELYTRLIEIKTNASQKSEPITEDLEIFEINQIKITYYKQNWYLIENENYFHLNDIICEEKTIGGYTYSYLTTNEKEKIVDIEVCNIINKLKNLNIEEGIEKINQIPHTSTKINIYNNQNEE